MTSNNDQFLAAEEAVRVLAGDIERLRTEMGGYAGARESLAGVRDRVVALIDQVSAVAHALQSAASATREISTERILADINRLHSQVTALKEALAASSESIRTATEKQIQTSEAVVTRSIKSIEVEQSRFRRRVRVLLVLNIVVAIMMSGMLLLQVPAIRAALMLDSP